ncbi:zinc metalloprotease [Coemansia sp. RSA 552]|nr:zinc metalloprotease [Coemansia sp. RSA 552]
MGEATPKKDRVAKKFGDDPDSVADAQARVVMQKGVLDDVIDGIQLGMVAIALICLIFVAVLNTSIPKIFPSTQPLFDLAMSVPGYARGVPELLVQLWAERPTTVDEGIVALQGLGACLSARLQQLPYKECVLGFSWAMYLWEAKLNVRQRDRLHEVRRPQAIAGFISRQVYLEANAYGLDKSSLQLVRDCVEQVQTTLIIVYDAIPWLWYAVGAQMEAWLGLAPAEHEIAQSVLFFMAATLVSTVLGLPFDLYSTFVVERRHGFNKQTWGLFFADMVKSLALTAVLGTPVVGALLWVIIRTGAQFYLYAWALMAGVQLLMIVIYPTVIQPLFNRFDPLPAGELREAIEALASRLHFPLQKLYVVDGSKRSSHSNAYIFGFFKAKRIVLYDTLISQCSVQQIVSVLGHELGHWRMNHMPKMLAMAQIQILLIFFSFSCFVGESSMYTSFGMYTQPVMVGFIFFQYLYGPLGGLLQFATNVVSRHHEFQADAFSKKLGYAPDLRQALIQLQIENKSSMNPDPLYSAYHYSHPPLVERLNALDDPSVAPKTE